MQVCWLESTDIVVDGCYLLFIPLGLRQSEINAPQQTKIGSKLGCKQTTLTKILGLHIECNKKHLAFDALFEF